ncbi:AbrB family transcriptional regulator [Billgrantia sp. LNSP4103-1]|uniref:AbrB family transcriptional regulator n=1 Tax=Billgrantia sp. LNSP4103-1 TaxID=3410266 RepID=UPI00403FB9DE
MRRLVQRRGGMMAVGHALLLGVLGGLLFKLLALPLPWMLGPLVANLVASMAGARLKMPGQLRELCLGIMGLVLGGQVTTELVERLPSLSLSLLLLSVGVVVATYVVTLWYRRCGLETTTAFFSALPGGMAAMVVLGEKLGNDVRGIAMGQSLRVVLVLLVLPPLFWVLEGGVSMRAEDAGTPGWQDAWLLLLLAVVPLGHRLRLPAPALLLPLTLGAALSVGGIGSLQLPAWAMGAVLLVLGSSIGTRFSGTSVRELLAYGRYALVATLLTLSVLAVFAELIHRWLGVPRDIALLALAPGGMAEMAVLAVALDMDPLYVTFHHLFRLVALMLIAPFIALRIGRRQMD